jgi:ABC-2 type transport system ATP-binding protein
MDTVIETHELTRTFGALEAVHELTLQLTTGKVLAFLGRNGAGKTTTIQLLAGLQRPTRGESRVLGTPSTALTPADWQCIGYVSENQELYDWMSGSELLAFTRALYRTWDRELESRLVRQLGVPVDRRIARCSRGERMKLALVLALAFRPKLLILDEPFSGLDPLSREELLSGVLETTAQNEWSVFFSTHDVDEVERLADEVAFLERGRLQLQEPLESLQARFRRVHVSTSDAAVANLASPDILDAATEGTTLRFVHTRFSEAVETDLRRRFGAAPVDVAPLSLREIFLALARSERQEAVHV